MVKNKFLSYLMFCGKKIKSQNIFIKSSKLLQKNIIKNSQKIIKLVVINSLPLICAKKLIRKKGKQKFLQEIPYILSKTQRISFAIKHIILILRAKKINKVSKLLQFEFLFHSKAFLQKKIDILHQNLLTKKKYAKFRWFL